MTYHFPGAPRAPRLATAPARTHPSRPTHERSWLRRGPPPAPRADAYAGQNTSERGIQHGCSLCACLSAYPLRVRRMPRSQRSATRSTTSSSRCALAAGAPRVCSVLTAPCSSRAQSPQSWQTSVGLPFFQIQGTVVEWDECARPASRPSRNACSPPMLATSQGPLRRPPDAAGAVRGRLAHADEPSPPSRKLVALSPYHHVVSTTSLLTWHALSCFVARSCRSTRPRHDD